MKSYRIAIVFASALSVAACVTDAGPKQTVGTLVGAGLGGLAGSQIGGGKGKLVAVGAGVLLGGLLGSEVGKSLDKADQLYAERNAQQTLEATP
ncbi:MAG: glycine zipper 2TM domain-containing protein, partial [Alphaproteobacteria bacterium]